jgi:DNA-directed RNA polymerase specialized sigma subunit
MEDKVRKGRQKSRAKLSLEDIDMIKHTYGSKIMQQGELAVVYGISQAQVSRIISGARW